MMKTTQSESGASFDVPAKVKWWDNSIEGSAVLDVTNPKALEWFKHRLMKLKYQYNVDGNILRPS